MATPVDKPALKGSKVVKDNIFKTAVWTTKGLEFPSRAFAIPCLTGSEEKKRRFLSIKVRITVGLGC